MRFLRRFVSKDLWWLLVIFLLISFIRTFRQSLAIDSHFPPVFDVSLVFEYVVIIDGQHLEFGPGFSGSYSCAMLVSPSNNKRFSHLKYGMV